MPPFAVAPAEVGAHDVPRRQDLDSRLRGNDGPSATMPAPLWKTGKLPERTQIMLINLLYLITYRARFEK